MLTELLIVFLTTMSPIVELRGAIPIGLALGLPVEVLVPVVFVVNCLVFFPIYFGLTIFYDHFFRRFGWFRKIIDRIHKKGNTWVNMAFSDWLFLWEYPCLSQESGQEPGLLGCLAWNGKDHSWRYVWGF